MPSLHKFTWNGDTPAPSFPDNLSLGNVSWILPFRFSMDWETCRSFSLRYSTESEEGSDAFGLTTLFLPKELSFLWFVHKDNLSEILFLPLLAEWLADLVVDIWGILPGERSVQEITKNDFRKCSCQLWHNSRSNKIAWDGILNLEDTELRGYPKFWYLYCLPELDRQVS